MCSKKILNTFFLILSDVKKCCGKFFRKKFLHKNLLHSEYLTNKHTHINKIENVFRILSVYAS